jgi:hypothetical protein
MASLLPERHFKYFTQQSGTITDNLQEIGQEIRLLVKKNKKDVPVSSKESLGLGVRRFVSKRIRGRIVSEPNSFSSLKSKPYTLPQADFISVLKKNPVSAHFVFIDEGAISRRLLIIFFIQFDYFH